MSKRNRYRHPQRDLNHEYEVLNSKVRLDGVGEDPLVRKMLSEEFVTMPDSEAGPIALALQELIRGQHSLLAQQDQMSDRIAQLERQWAEYDKHAKEWEQDRVKFVEDHFSEAERKLELSPSQKAQLQARAAADLQQATSAARVRNSVDAIQFEIDLSHMPTEKVMSPGVWVNKSLPNGGSQKVLIAEEVRIKSKLWRLPPNQMVEVPKIVADILRERRQSQQETQARKDAFQVQENGSIPSQEELAKRWSEIDKQYGSGTEAMPLAAA